MLSTWSFSLLLLGSVLGSPLYHNHSKNRTSDHVPPYETNSQDNSSSSTVGCEGLSCGSSQNYTALDTAENSTSTFHGKRLFSPPEGRVVPLAQGRCFLPTCAVHHLSEKLQTGDEKAGDTWDPYGIGKR